MTSWKQHTIFIALLLALVLGLLTTPVRATSNFVRVPLGKGASIEVPKNWVVFSNNKLTTLDAFVEAKGYRLTESTLNFAANLYDDQNKTVAFVNVRFYPNNPFTQEFAKQITPDILKDIDLERNKTANIPYSGTGFRVLKLFGSKMQLINGLYVIVHELQLSGSGDLGTSIIRGVRVLRSPRSFTVTLSYQENDAEMLLPIINYMTNSIRQD